MLIQKINLSVFTFVFISLFLGLISTHSLPGLLVLNGHAAYMKHKPGSKKYSSGEMNMSSVKKIGLFYLYSASLLHKISGIALLPANLASIAALPSGQVISIIGAMSLAYVYARLATKNPQQGVCGPICALGKYLRCLVQTGVLYYQCKLDW